MVYVTENIKLSLKIIIFIYLISAEISSESKLLISERIKKILNDPKMSSKFLPAAFIKTY